MPLPKPLADESRDEFFDRCMANPTMNGEFPDAKERGGVCGSLWDDREKRIILRQPRQSMESGFDVDWSEGDISEAEKLFDKPIKNIRECLAGRGEPLKRISEGVYGGYLVRFTSPGEKDLTGEYFDAETDFMLGTYPIKGLRALYEHGFDEDLGSIPIGEVITARVDPLGIYAEKRFDLIGNFKAYIGGINQPDKWKDRQIEVAQQYHNLLKDMLDNGVLVMEGGRPVRKNLGWSSGAHPPAVRVSSNGHIDRWPIWEATATLRPAMPNDTTIQKVKMLDHVQLKDLLRPAPRN